MAKPTAMIAHARIIFMKSPFNCEFDEWRVDGGASCRLAEQYDPSQAAPISASMCRLGVNGVDENHRNLPSEAQSLVELMPFNSEI